MCVQHWSFPLNLDVRTLLRFPQLGECLYIYLSFSLSYARVCLCIESNHKHLGNVDLNLAASRLVRWLGRIRSISECSTLEFSSRPRCKIRFLFSAIWRVLIYLHVIQFVLRVQFWSNRKHLCYPGVHLMARRLSLRSMYLASLDTEYKVYFDIT